MKDQIRLIAMDMDGTLLNDKEQISQENRVALQRAVRAGVHIAICSGRMANDISYFASDAELTTCAILGLNGCCCLPAPHQAPYVVHTMASKTVQILVETLFKHRVTFGCFQPDHVIVVQNDPSVQKLNWGTYIDRGEPNGYLYGEKALMCAMEQGVCKIVYIDEDHSARIDTIRNELIKVNGLCVTSSWTNNLEFMPEGVHKGLALQLLAHKLGIDASQVMALGDFDNDLEMIRYAGYGIAMGNASERVKKAARAVTLSNTENGVAKAIETYVL